jgi:poly-gamma-glutamate synthesis protein (capsule biosynthesis protein)
MSRKLAKAGADIVIHHHPHTLQGIEIYEGTLIAYSLGNFIFPVHSTEYMKDREGNADESVILQADIDFKPGNRKSINYQLIPTIIDEDNVTKFADGDRKDNIIKKMTDYSIALNNRSYLRQKYFSSCFSQAKKFFKLAYYTLSDKGVLSTYRYIRLHISTKMHRNWMRGVLTFGWY